MNEDNSRLQGISSNAIARLVKQEQRNVVISEQGNGPTLWHASPQVIQSLSK